MTQVAPVPPATRKPVMADVARLAGVSHQTVSRVVNGHPSLRPETRRRVEEAIEQLGYRPNPMARALVTRRSATVGVIATNGGHWGPATVHEAVQAAARARGYAVSSVNLPEVSRRELSAAVEHLRDHGVEGIIMIVASDEALDVARGQQTGGVPVVVVEGDLSRAPWTVGVDQLAGARLAVQHLLSLGHTRIAHVAGPAHWVEARARLEGWRDCLVEAGLPPADLVEGDWTAPSGYAAGRLLAERAQVSAVFVANDHMAIGVLRALHESGRRVPEDVSLVGFDDVPEAEFLVPGLTTVRQDFTAVGRTAIDVLHLAIGLAGEGAPASDRLNGSLHAPELVLRRSTAAPPR